MTARRTSVAGHKRRTHLVSLAPVCLANAAARVIRSPLDQKRSRTYHPTTHGRRVLHPTRGSCVEAVLVGPSPRYTRHTQRPLRTFASPTQEGVHEPSEL